MGAAVGRNEDGRLEVFAVSYSWFDRNLMRFSSLWHSWQSLDGSWSPWSKFGAPKSPWPIHSLAVGSNDDGRLELFAKDRNDEDVYQIWQTAPNNGWSEIWHNMRKPDIYLPLQGRWSPALSSAKDRQGRQHLFYASHSASAVIFVASQIEKNKGWSDWVALSLDPQSQFKILLRGVVSNHDGRLEYFYQDDEKSHSIFHAWQDAAGAWLQSVHFGRPTLGRQHDNIVISRPVQRSDGRLAVFALTENGLWERAQIAQDGGYGNWSPIKEKSTYPWGELNRFAEMEVIVSEAGHVEIFVMQSQALYRLRER